MWRWEAGSRETQTLEKIPELYVEASEASHCFTVDEDGISATSSWCVFHCVFCPCTWAWLPLRWSYQAEYMVVQSGNVVRPWCQWLILSVKRNLYLISTQVINYERQIITLMLQWIFSLQMLLIPSLKICIWQYLAWYYMGQSFFFFA